MKKLAMSVAACAMVLTGLGTASSASAQPYPGAVPTKTTIVSAPTVIPRGTRPNMKVKVAPISGNARVRGTLRMTCTRPFGSTTRTRLGPAEAYRGVALYLPGPALFWRGTWSCSVHFNGGSTVFASSGAGPRTVRVR